MDVNPDGQFYHISSMKITDENPDFRIAAIYKIAMIIWNLKQEKTTMAKKIIYTITKVYKTAEIAVFLLQSKNKGVRE